MLTLYGYHSSHEQFTPSELRTYAQAAEAAGFDSVMSSDHFNPWSVRQGQSGFTWSWLGAAMQTTSLPFGSLCIPGGWRYHPALLAQAIGTLAELFPGRLPWVAAGSGQALSEEIVGRGWPDKPERVARLEEGVRIMRALWGGETVDRPEGIIPTREAKLWTLPPTPPKIYGAALTVETAQRIGAWADGMITVNQDKNKLSRMIEAFRAGGGDGKPLVLQVHVSWAESDAEAEANAHHQWRSNTLSTDDSQAYHSPHVYDQRTEDASADDLHNAIVISSDTAVLRSRIADFAALGFDEIYLHNVGRNQAEFIRIFGEFVLPALRR